MKFKKIVSALVVTALMASTAVMPTVNAEFTPLTYNFDTAISDEWVSGSTTGGLTIVHDSQDCNGATDSGSTKITVNTLVENSWNLYTRGIRLDVTNKGLTNGKQYAVSFKAKAGRIIYGDGADANSGVIGITTKDGGTGHSNGADNMVWLPLKEDSWTKVSKVIKYETSKPWIVLALKALRRQDKDSNDITVVQPGSTIYVDDIVIEEYTPTNLLAGEVEKFKYDKGDFMATGTGSDGAYTTAFDSSVSYENDGSGSVMLTRSSKGWSGNWRERHGLYYSTDVKELLTQDENYRLTAYVKKGAANTSSTDIKIVPIVSGDAGNTTLWQEHMGVSSKTRDLGNGWLMVTSTFKYDKAKLADYSYQNRSVYIMVTLGDAKAGEVFYVDNVSIEKYTPLDYFYENFEGSVGNFTTVPGNDNMGGVFNKAYANVSKTENDYSGSVKLTRADSTLQGFTTWRKSNGLYISTANVKGLVNGKTYEAVAYVKGDAANTKDNVQKAMISPVGENQEVIGAASKQITKIISNSEWQKVRTVFKYDAETVENIVIAIQTIEDVVGESYYIDDITIKETEPVEGFVEDFEGDMGKFYASGEKDGVLANLQSGCIRREWTAEEDHTANEGGALKLTTTKDGGMTEANNNTQWIVRRSVMINNSDLRLEEGKTYQAKAYVKGESIVNEGAKTYLTFIDGEELTMDAAGEKPVNHLIEPSEYNKETIENGKWVEITANFKYTPALANYRLAVVVEPLLEEFGEVYYIDDVSVKEAEAVLPTKLTVEDVTVKNGADTITTAADFKNASFTVSFNVNNYTDEEQNYVITAAAYDGNTLVAVDSESGVLNAGAKTDTPYNCTLDLTGKQGTYTLKLFAWDSYGNMMPIGDIVTPLQ